MYKKILVICLILFVTANIASAGRIINSGYGVQNNYRKHFQQGPQMTEPSQTPKEYLDDKSNLSTFGIIAIIFVVIICCLVFYYGIICYPFLCPNEKIYEDLHGSNSITGSSTITEATSDSIPSILIDRPPQPEMGVSVPYPNSSRLN